MTAWERIEGMVNEAIQAAASDVHITYLRHAAGNDERLVRWMLRWELVASYQLTWGEARGLFLIYREHCEKLTDAQTLEIWESWVTAGRLP